MVLRYAASIHMAQLLNQDWHCDGQLDGTQTQAVTVLL
jgi:hypothetical protein